MMNLYMYTKATPGSGEMGADFLILSEDIDRAESILEDELRGLNGSLARSDLSYTVVPAVRDGLVRSVVNLA